MTANPKPPPRDGVRAMMPGPGLGEDGRTLYGRLAGAGEWAEISSKHPRVTSSSATRPGAFRKTVPT